MWQYPAVRGHHAGWLVAGLVAAGLACWAALPAETVRAFFWEGGPVERLTEALYLAAAAFVWTHRRSPRGDTLLRLALTVTLLAAAAREADWHKHWTGTSALRVSYYYGNAPAAQRLVAALVVAAVLVAVWHLVRRARRGWWPALRRGEAFAATVGVLLAALAAGKLLERSRAVLAEQFGIAMTTATADLVRVLEETLELSLPLLALLAVLQYLAPPAPKPPR